MIRQRATALFVGLALGLGSLVTVVALVAAQEGSPVECPAASADASPDAAAATAQDAFFDRLGALCGQAFAGTLAANEPPSTTPVAGSLTPGR